MEKNTNANANPNINVDADINTVPESTSPDQRHSRETSPMAVSPPPASIDDNNPTPPVINLSSVAPTPERATTGDVGTSSLSTHGHVGGGSNTEVGKKRGRGDGGEQQQQVKAAKKKGELTEVPKGDPKCATCNKVFKSWKALFGHLRSHPERTYRGALPPPTAAELDIRHCQQQFASTLLTVAQGVAASRRGLDIDLNQPSAAEESESPEKSGGVGFDLNVEQPPESDNDE
ncbi:hypothetical protein SDJN02_23495, partial [Cucurbita argyrosperma subsp. argyrosperma]